jgi:hypothetical protein
LKRHHLLYALLGDVVFHGMICSMGEFGLSGVSPLGRWGKLNVLGI